MYRAALLLTGAAVADATAPPTCDVVDQLVQTFTSCSLTVPPGGITPADATAPYGFCYYGEPTEGGNTGLHEDHTRSNHHLPPGGTPAPDGRYDDRITCRIHLQSTAVACPFLRERGVSGHHAHGSQWATTGTRTDLLSDWIAKKFQGAFPLPWEVKFSNHRCTDTSGSTPPAKVQQEVTIILHDAPATSASPIEVWTHNPGVFCSHKWDHTQTEASMPLGVFTHGYWNVDECKTKCVEHNAQRQVAGHVREDSDECVGISVTNAQWPHPQQCGICIHGTQLGVHGSYNSHMMGVSPVGGDPFTSYNGKRTQFYLPIHTPVKLLTCGGVEMHGQTMPSGVAGDTQQWFEKIDVRVGGKDAMSVTVRNTAQLRVPSSAAKADLVDVDVLATQNRVAAALATLRRQDSVKNAAARELTTLDVTVDGRAVTTTAVRTFGDANVTVAQGTDRIGLGFVESVDFDSDVIGIQVQSSAATKFHDKNSVAFTHLDMTFKSIEATTCTGPLPEIWGVRPMTPTTAKYLSPYYQTKFIPMK